MNREEAAEFTRKLVARAETIVFPKTPKTINNIPVFYFEAVLSALCGPQPDPITGLVPCGCAGKPEYHSSKYGYVASVKMHAECPDCHAKTAEYYAFLYSDGALEELQRRVMDAWNTMRGYKEAPE